MTILKKKLQQITKTPEVSQWLYLETVSFCARGSQIWALYLLLEHTAIHAEDPAGLLL